MSKHRLKVCKARIAVLQSAVNANERRIKRMSHKSRACRQQYGEIDGRRRDFFMDRMQELELVVAYMEGRISKKTFMDAQVNERIR